MTRKNTRANNPGASTPNVVMTPTADATGLKQKQNICQSKFKFHVKELKRLESKLDEYLHADNLCLLRSVKAEIVFQNTSLCDSYVECTQFSDDEEWYDELVEQKENVLLMTSKIDSVLENKTDNFSADTNREILTQNSGIKLPTFELPVFSGEFRNWLNFKEIFRTSIGDSKQLSGIQKLSYLQTCVKGSANKLISGFSLSEENFKQAWETLCHRFDDKRELAFAQLAKIYSVKHARVGNPKMLMDMLDVCNESLRNLKTLGFEINPFVDILLVYHIESRLEEDVRQRWELSQDENTIPSFSQLATFLEKQARSMSTSKDSNVIPESKPKFVKRSYVNNTVVKPNAGLCVVCNESHPLFRCPKFMKMSLEQRWDTVKEKKVCVNCLRRGHFAVNCSLATHCKSCNGSHNTLLHRFKPERIGSSGQSDSLQIHPQGGAASETTQVGATCCTNKVSESNTLLSTAIVQIKTPYGTYVKCRALVDNGSQRSLISKDCCELLELPVKKTKHVLSGVNDKVLETSFCETELTFTSHFNNREEFQTSALVVNKVTTDLPNFKFSPHNWRHLEDLILADPSFAVAGKIDLLIGADLYSEIIVGQPIFGSKGSPAAIKTRLGWIVSGRVFGSLSQSKPILNCHIATNLDCELKKFWELESVPTSDATSPEDQMCEDLYGSTVSRDSSGRYIVKLPLKPNTCIGETQPQVLRRFQFLETKLSKNQALKQNYQEFMREYLELQHMEPLPEEKIANPCYLPHHGVFKEDSSTTKLRVVFDASMKSTSGKSLNDCLCIGPKLQSDLFSTLLKFRCFPIALSADIEKMYRQILVSPEDQNNQLILWRFDQHQPISTYRLRTVTYGTACAPYLAIRTLRQLALDEQHRFPKASQATLSDFYVDDFLSGVHSATEGEELVEEMNDLMRSGGFTLRKWASNKPEVLHNLPDHLKSLSNAIPIQDDSVLKVLGVNWNPEQDKLQVKLGKETNVQTKRQLLSVIARIFDPLGILSPTTISLKIILQQLWKDKLAWDQPIPTATMQSWTKFNSEFELLQQIKVPRYIQCSVPDATSTQIHGFCDASTKAYAAVFYLRTVLLTGEIVVNLIAAKTKVAPVKAITLPRLELCAALLLAQLYKVIVNILPTHVFETQLWSDSQIVLCWLNSEPSKLETFVSHRVTKIHSLVETAQWNHIKGLENPADCASRGIMPKKLLDHELWWKGPPWLSQEIIPLHPCVKITDMNDRTVDDSYDISVNCLLQTNYIHDSCCKYSSFSVLIRVMSYVLRFIHNCRHPAEKLSGYVQTSEHVNAIYCIVRVVQTVEFSAELSLLKKNKLLPHNSKLLPLNVFLDCHELIRVGGRLSKCENLSEDKKHPMLMPKDHAVTRAIINHYHATYLHAGPQLVLSLLRQRFWILHGRATVRQELRKCLPCFKLSTKPSKQIMGDLPSERITPNRPFCKVGIDFAGPFLTKPNVPRSKVKVKSYLCLIICMCTKAVHLELVSDLSSEALMAALRRFVSRRGLPSDIFSDNGTNFKGAARQLKEIHTLCKTQEVQAFCTDHLISWHFIPPYSPNFGGLWESSIKITKYYITRSCKAALLTFEEMCTLLCQIEACINSRPLIPLSSDPSDLQALTPGHFIIGAPLLQLPEPTSSVHKVKLTARWKLIQSTRTHFWTRWSKEYLHTLQPRMKWKTSSQDLQVNDMVVIHDPHTPPLQWTIGRVIKTFPGPDQRVRVATIHTKKGEVTRSICRLSVLPFTSSPGPEDVEN